MNQSKKTVRFTVSMPSDAYGNFKKKAQDADVSMSKFIHRAGSIVETEQIIDYPKYGGGVPSQSEQMNG